MTPTEIAQALVDHWIACGNAASLVEAIAEKIAEARAGRATDLDSPPNHPTTQPQRTEP